MKKLFKNWGGHKWIFITLYVFIIILMIFNWSHFKEWIHKPIYRATLGDIVMLFWLAYFIFKSLKRNEKNTNNK